MNWVRGAQLRGRWRACRLYGAWRAMRYRCLNSNAEHYKNYGGRGVSICPEWSDYAVFRQWAIANGYRKGLSLDRKDNDGNYEPNNCRWATAAQQANNRRTVRGAAHHKAKLTEGQVNAIRKSKRPKAELAEKYGVTLQNISAVRARKSWTHI